MHLPAHRGRCLRRQGLSVCWWAYAYCSNRYSSLPRETPSPNPGHTRASLLNESVLKRLLPA